MDLLSSILRRCNITKASEKDASDIRLQQIELNGKAHDAEVYMPYGMSANIPPGSLGILLQIGGDEGFLVVLPDKSGDRIKGLAENEVAFFNPITKSRTIYRSNGDIEQVVTGENGTKSVTIKKDLTIVVGGDVNLTATGDVDVTADNVNIDAATTNLGVGGQPIARVGDSIQVVGVSTGGSTVTGTITSGGANTSI